MRRLIGWGHCLVIGLVVGTRLASAEVPQLLHYQGQLADQNDVALQGEHTVTFRIYDTATGGTELWSESHPITLPRTGIFSVVLGSLTSLGTLDFNRSPLYLAIEVDGEGEMSPRQRLTSVIYAINAKTLQGVDASQLLRADVDTVASHQLKLTHAGVSLLIQPATDPPPDTNLLEVRNAAGATTFSADLEGDVSVAGNLSVSGTIAGSTSTTGTTSPSWTIGSAMNAATSNISLLFGNTSGQESIVFQGAGAHDFVFSENIRLNPQGQLQFPDAAGSGHVALRAPAAVATHILTLPATLGSTGQVLSTDASGNLSWVSVTTSSGTLTSVDSGAGLTGGPITSSGALDIGAGFGIQVNPDDVAVKLSSGAGLLADATGVSLLRSCADGELLKWNVASSAWQCAADNNAGSGGTVTSITASGGLTATPNPLTATGTISIAPGGVTSAAIAAGAITQAQLASDSVGAAALRSDAIQPGDIDVGDLPAHASAHQPGGVDPLPTATAVNIGSSNSVGASTSLARADHVHQGLHSLSAAGQPPLVGDASLAAGPSVILSQTGQVITIAAPPGNRVTAVNLTTPLTINTTAETTLLSATITKSQNSSILLILATVQLNDTGNPPTKTVDLKLFRGSTQLDANYSSLIGTAAQAVSQVPVTLHFWDAPPAGTYSFRLTARSSGAGAQATIRRLTVIELL